MKKLLFFLMFFENLTIFAQPIEEIKDLINNNKYEEALDIMSSYTEFISTHPHIAYYIGICYFKLQNYQKAEEFFELALKNNYTQPELYYNLGVTKYKLKNYKEAITYLEKAKNSSLLGPSSLYTLISCYIKIKDYKKVKDTYEELYTKYPSSLYILKSQTLLEKAGIDYAKFYKTTKTKYSLNFSVEYGNDSNLSYIPEYEISYSTPIEDNFFSYQGGFSIFTKNFYGYYKYYKKDYLNTTNDLYNYSYHSLSLRQKLYEEAGFSFYGKIVGGYYLNKEPENTILTAQTIFELPLTSQLSNNLTLSYSKYDYLKEGSNYLDGDLKSAGYSLNYNYIGGYVNLNFEIKSRQTSADFIGSEYNYSYFIVLGTSSYFNDVYTPYLKSYSYNLVSLDFSITHKISRYITFLLSFSYDNYKYFSEYENYEKLNNIYLWDINQLKWFVYAENGWIETTKPQPKKIYTERVDNVIDVLPTITIMLTKNLKINLSYSYTYSNSTIQQYKWKKELFYTSLQLSFF